MGSVAPLLAVHKELQKRSDYRGVWVGLDVPKEKAFVAGRGFEEHAIVSPRFRNFEGQGLSFTMLSFPFRLWWGFFQALRLIRDTKPKAHLSAGSFVSLPVALACFVMRVPNIVHQQDLLPGLANRVMSWMADTVTVAFPVLAPTFGAKAVVTGNPVREEVLRGFGEAARARYGFDSQRPTVFVIGGSSGALGLNAMIREILPELLKRANVLHMTGAGEQMPKAERGYAPVAFLGPEIADAYALADVVIARAGLSTMTELGALKKATILVPGPVHQHANTDYFASEGAAIVVTQEAGARTLLETTSSLLDDAAKREALGANAARLFPSDAAERIANLLAK